MNGFLKPSGLVVFLILLSLLLPCGLVLAQDESEESDQEQVEVVDEEEDVADLGSVTVTGSRLQRETYTSIAPLQIITAEGSREVGLIDATSILQGSTAASGQQIDLTFNGFVLDNGPGATTLSLRGLGSARTLVLVNGRRLAPAGVEGAPISADINLVPSSLVQQYDLLLDGASSIYGSDAVAGVANIILRNDFNGFEIEADYQYPEIGSGETANLSVVWGKNFDRGFIGAGVDFFNAKRVPVGDVGAGCAQDIEIDQNGDIRDFDIRYREIFNMDFDGTCADSGSVGWLSNSVTGSAFYTPGRGNFLSDFSDWNTFGFGPDLDGDGFNDVNFSNFNINGSQEERAGDFRSEQERINFMAYGEYVFEGEMNNTVFFELMYNERETQGNAGPPQLFPFVPGSNPFNPCNPDGINGVDCGLAEDALFTNPVYIEQFANFFFEDTCAPQGLTFEQCTPAAFGVLNGPIGPLGLTPVVGVRGDRNLVDTNIKQYRAVLGMRGDLPFMDFGPFSAWQYDLWGSYTESDGSSSRPGIRGDLLSFSLANTFIDENGNVQCTDGQTTCVPINMFAPSLYPSGNGSILGDFATQAERDYLFDTRDFDTTYKQTIFSGFAGGFVGDLPGGPITAGLGFEWRIDDINSIPDEVARDGLFFGFFADGGAIGDKTTRELFAEVELPLLAGMPGIEELTANISGRLTDDEFYGTAYTYSGKIGWRPVSNLLIRGTYGTSYRAPNVRELFLRDQSGFGNVFDPCIIPADALDDFTGEYNPSLDTRDQIVLQNCINQGVDPTTLDNGGLQTLSTEVATGGTTDIDEETSTSFSYGFAFEQPWFDAFNLTIGATYYDINIEDAIIEPSSQFLVNDCYNDEQLDSSFCNRIVRDADGFIDIINAGFINQNQETAAGVDINIDYDQDFSVGNRPFNMSVNVVANHITDFRQEFINDDGSVDTDDDDSEFGFPNWRATSQFALSTGDWRFNWETRFIGGQRQDPDGVDGFNDIFDSTGEALSQTCLGPPTDVLCRDVAEVTEYFLHTASVFYNSDNWVLGFGVRNVFDEDPPRVNGTEVTSINNYPLGVGYDFLGRTYFVTLGWRQ